MKNLDLPFKIGEEYQVWEFDLEVLDDVSGNKNWDKYRYIKTTSWLNFIPTDVELFFSWDYLEAVIITYQLKSKEELEILISTLIKKINSLQSLITKSKNETTYEINKNLKIKTKVIKSKNLIKVTYASADLIAIL